MIKLKILENKVVNWFKRYVIAKKYSLTHEENALVNKVVQKLIDGKKDWSTEELQIQQNYPEVIEELLLELVD